MAWSPYMVSLGPELPNSGQQDNECKSLFGALLAQALPLA